MRYYIIHFPTPEPKFFTGFRPNLSDENPELLDSWDSRRAALIEARELKLTERDLKELGIEGFTTSAVDL